MPGQQFTVVHKYPRLVWDKAVTSQVNDLFSKYIKSYFFSVRLCGVLGHGSTGVNDMVGTMFGQVDISVKKSMTIEYDGGVAQDWTGYSESILDPGVVDYVTGSRPTTDNQIFEVA